MIGNRTLIDLGVVLEFLPYTHLEIIIFNLTAQISLIPTESLKATVEHYFPGARLDLHFGNDQYFIHLLSFLPKVIINEKMASLFEDLGVKNNKVMYFPPY